MMVQHQALLSYCEGVLQDLPKSHNDNSGRGLVGPAETIENDAVFDRFGAVFDRFGAVFNRLGAVFDRKRRRNEAFELDSNCQAPQRAWQFESNSNAKV